MAGVSRSDNPAIRLYRDAGGPVALTKEISRLLSTGAETLIEAAILVVAGEREIIGRRAAAPSHAGQNNFFVRLNCKARGEIKPSKEVGRLLTARSKGLIQAPI